MHDWNLLARAIITLARSPHPLSIGDIIDSINEQRIDFLSDGNAAAALSAIFAQEEGVTLTSPDAGRTWALTPNGFMLARRLSVEPECEDGAQDETPRASLPRDAGSFARICIDAAKMNALHAMQMIREGRIRFPDVHPALEWTAVQQSRFIESIMLGIAPLTVHLDASSGVDYVVADGRRRLMALHRFCNEGTLTLTGLEALRQWEGATFDRLPAGMRFRIEGADVLARIVLPETPLEMKGVIYRRLHASSPHWTHQEIRRSITHRDMDRATQLLTDLARSPEFLAATDYSVIPQRMDDVECVLRFMAFTLYPYHRIGVDGNHSGAPHLETLLDRAMTDLHQASDDEHHRLATLFRDSMRKASLIFGRDAFRRMPSTIGRRPPINKPLFEVWSVLLNDWTFEAVERSRVLIRDAFADVLTRDRAFVASITHGTATASAIVRRFSRIDALLHGVRRIGRSLGAPL